jgi:hypothetical protein
MSSALAIAAVTAVLKNQLINISNLDQWGTDIVGEIKISALPPDRISTEAEHENRLNLFMYHVTPNAGWRNLGLPSRDSNGQRVSNPPLALDLHYLLTAYSSQEFYAEMLLGYAMQVFHEMPVLPRDTIRQRLNELLPGLGVLVSAELAEQVEQIKICPQVLGTEELSRFWTALQTHYRPTVAYQVSVVLIESKLPSRSALPARTPHWLVKPFSRPVIDSVSPQIIGVGEALSIKGQNLNGDIVKVKFSSLPDPVDATIVSDTQITVIPPSGLFTGVNTVQVIHPLDFGTGSPSEPHHGFESNVAVFLLRPRIDTALPDLPLMQVHQGTTLTLAVTPAVGRSQQATLLLNDLAIAANVLVVTDTGRVPRPDPTRNLDFPIPGDFPIGTYFIRVRVDGVESPLLVDNDRASPTYNQYTGPKIEITGG